MKTYRHRITTSVTLSFLCVIFFNGHVVADQTGSTGHKKPMPAKLAIIAVGPKPPRRFGDDGENGAAAILPPRPGEVPPGRLYYENKKKGKNSSQDTDKVVPAETMQSINVTFNNPSHFVKVPENRTLDLLRKPMEGGDSLSRYITISPLKPGSITVALLRPTGKGDKRWVSEPKLRFIDLLDEKLKEKKLVILNLSHQPVKTIFHDDKTLIKAGGYQTYETVKGIELHKMAAAYGKDNKIIYNTALRLNRGDRILLYVLYDANPYTNDGRHVGIFRTAVEPEEIQKEGLEKQKSSEANDSGVPE